MSLFGTYDWWLSQCTKKENEECLLEKENLEFHAESLYLVDLVKDGPQVILVGNLLGTLWAFKPSSANLSQDLLFEYNFQEPILAMQSGYLLLGSNEKHLAVLHPTKLKVYSFNMTTGNVAHGQQFYLDPVYVITFEFVAYNFVIGPFGPMASKATEKLEKDKSTWPKSTQTSICVQSLDGHLHFYVNDLNFLCPPSKNTLKKPATLKNEVPSEDLKLPYNLRHSGKANFPREKEIENSFNITKADVHNFPANDMSSISEKISDNEEASISLHGMNLNFPVEEDEGNVPLFKNESKANDLNECAIQISKPKFTVAPFEDTFLPTLLCYIPADDCFIISSGSWLLNCYSYRNLELQQIGQRKKKTILPEWTYILGEPIFYLTFLQYIFALGTRGNLVALNRYGVPRFFIDLSFCPSAFHPYISDGKIMFLAVSEEKILLVYDGGPAPCDPNDPRLYSLQPPTSPCITRLVWSAKLPSIPIALSVGNFEELVGLIVILSEQGYVHCCYLGTSPRNFMEMPRENIQFTEEPEEEDATKLKHPAIEWNTSLKSDNEVDSKLEIIFNTVNLRSSNECVKRAIDIEEIMDKKFLETNCTTAEINFTLILCPVTPLNNVCISASVDQPFVASFEKKFIARLNEEMKISLQVTAHYCELVTHDEIPNMRMEVMVSGYGSCNVATERLSLQVYHACYLMPLSVVSSIDKSLHLEKSEDPVPEVKFELELQGQKFPSLNALFPEFDVSAISSKTSKLDILLYGNPHKRIQVAMESDSYDGNLGKDRCVYSISSKHPLPLYFMVIVLAERIEIYQSSLRGHLVESGKIQKENLFRLNSLSLIPLRELLEAIDNHYIARLRIMKLNHSLSIYRKQLHLAECSVLSKVRDVTPKHSVFSETVLEKLFDKVMNEISSLKQAQQALEDKRRELIFLWQILQKMQPELSGNNILKSLLEITCCDLPEDGLQQGWEERTEVGLYYILKQPKKSNSENLNVISAESEECNKLQIHSLKDEISELLQKCIEEDQLQMF